VADRIKKELAVDVEKNHGNYGEYKVLVDGETVIDDGSKVIFGVFPSGKRVIEEVRRKLYG
jgi:hypothetical protein